MNLFVESTHALRWAFKVLSAFWRVRPLTALAVILAKVGNRFCNMLAFFLPLKVVLLAGSDGVPRYFQFFIEASDKKSWIMLLSLCAVGFYLLTLVLDALIKSLSESGGTEVLQGANEIAVASRQREEVKGYYSRFSGIAANVIVVVLGYAIIGLLNPLLVVALMTLVLLQFLFTAWVVQHGDHLKPGRLLRMVKLKLGAYLDVLGSINFLSGFFVLLIPFLLYGDGNLLVAILSILLMRQTSGALKGIASATSDLWKKRLQVDPMIFRHRQAVRIERAVSMNLRQAFIKSEREELAHGYLERQGGESLGRVESYWEDSPVKGIYTFHLRDDDRHWLQRVFPKSQLHLLEHEQFLFDNLDRACVLAPDQVARFSVGPFECHVAEYGEGECIALDEWETLLPELTQFYWSLEIPQPLLDAYITSRQTLEGRLTPELFKRLEVALDTPRVEKDYARFMERLSRIKSLISEVPLYIYNPELIRRNVIKRANGDPLVMSWGRWSVEHLGVAMPKAFTHDKIEETLKQVRKSRRLGESEVSVHHLALVSACRTLEREIAQASYGQALSTLETVIANPLLNVEEHEYAD